MTLFRTTIVCFLLIFSGLAEAKQVHVKVKVIETRVATFLAISVLA